MSRAVEQWLADVGLTAPGIEEVERLERVSRLAPTLVPSLRASPNLTREVAGGAVHAAADRVSGDADVGAWAADGRCRALLRWLLGQTESPGGEMSGVYDAVARALLAQIQPEVGIVALGRYAAQEVGPTSDADALLAGSGKRAGEPARVLALVRAGSRLPEPMSFDFGPPGPRRVFVRGGPGPEEGWRRLVWTRLRLVQGSSRGCQSAWESVPKGWSPEDTRAYQAHGRARLRSTVPAQQANREVRLSPGGLAEAEAVLSVGFLVAQEPTAPPPGSAERVAWAVRTGWLAPDEASDLLAAIRFLAEVAARSELLGYGPSIVPENPDKLAIVAEETGLGGANEVLKELARCRETVSAVSAACLGRLKG